MKKFLVLLMIFCMLSGSAGATIIEPRGINLEFKRFTGIEAKRAVVLCRSLSVRNDRYDNARKVNTLSAGDTFLTWESWDGWCNCYYSDGAETAWVRNAYVLEDPAYYLTDGQTPVYAYGDTMAPRVALLTRNEELPIILETDEWCVVSLRGAAGWIRKTAKDTAHRFWFQPESLQSIKRAELIWNDGSSVVTDPQVLSRLATLLTDAEDMGGPIAGCVGDIYLALELEEDEHITMALTFDDCAIYRVDGRDYRYGYSIHASNKRLFELFPEYHR